MRPAPQFGDEYATGPYTDAAVRDNKIAGNSIFHHTAAITSGIAGKYPLVLKHRINGNKLYYDTTGLFFNKDTCANNPTGNAYYGTVTSVVDMGSGTLTEARRRTTATHACPGRLLHRRALPGAFPGGMSRSCSVCRFPGQEFLLTDDELVRDWLILVLLFGQQATPTGGDVAANPAAFGQAIAACAPASLNKPHPLMPSFETEHQIQGERDGLCRYTQTMPGDMHMECG